MYYHFSSSATLVKEDRKEKIPSETEQQFSSGLSGSIKIPEQ